MKRIIFICCSSLLLIFLAACTLPESTPASPTATMGPSPTPTNVPSPTPSLTPPPTATPLPSVRIGAGEKAIADGNFSQARQEYQAALASNTDDKVRAEAMWGLAKNDFMEENFPSALENLRQLTQSYPNSDEGIHGWILLGETYYALHRYQEASGAFQKYLELRPGLLDAYVQKRIGDSFSAIGDQSNAQKAYLASEQADGQLDLVSIRIDIANTYLNSGDPENALKIYDQIFDATSNDYVKAQMDLQSGQALLALNRPEEAYGRWRHAVDNYPLSYDSYSALVGLVDAGQNVDQFNRGLVDYSAQKYDVALRAFQLYTSENPNHDGTVLHYLALTLREMGDFNAAIAMWDRLIDKYPGNRYWATAWDEKATTQWVYLEDYAGAAHTLETFANETLGSPYAPTYLFDAARIYERSGDLEKAAALWESLPDRFDQDPSAANAWFQAGIARYRQQNFPKANNDFQQALLLAKELPDRARALLWIGKTYAATNDTKNARSAWEQAQTTDPNGYYSLRAEDLLANRQPFASPPSTNLNFDLQAERNEAAAWLRIKFDLPASTDLNGPGDLRSNGYFQRGAEFWKIGLFDEARLEFEALRETLKTNPADSFRLGNYLLDIGAYRSGIYAIREVLTMAGFDDHSSSLTAPLYFKHVRYGLYFKDLVWPASEENGIDPLFVTSVIRQESLFEGFVRSTAGARGLMQIISSTGEGIATQMGWPPEFTPDDLYSPYVNIRLGTFYLNANRRLLSGDLYATLAAYNGGPGNASIWQNLAKGDLDLELEIIRYGETRDYIRSIFETYSIYRGLYSPMQ